MKKQQWMIGLLVAVLLIGVPWAVRAQTDLDCEDLAPSEAGPSYFIGLGNAFFAEGTYAVAIVAYNCALERDPDHAPALVNRGYAYVAQRDNDRALADYNRALALDAGLLSAYNNRGMLYMSQGNFGLAITDFTVALTIDPDYAVAYHNRGLVHAAEGNYDLALADFEQAIALDSSYAAPHAAVGAVYSAMALGSYQTYLDLSGDHARLPGGEPDTILNALAESLQTRNFFVWLPFLTPAPW